MKKLLIIIGVTVGLNTSIVAGPIHEAAKNGDINAVQAELDKGVDVNYVDDNLRTTPLYLAVENGHIDIAKLLIANNANVNATAPDNLRGAAGQFKVGTTVVFEAADNFDMMDLLIRSGADLNIKSKRHLVTVLHTLAASESESENVIKILNLIIDNGVYINSLTAPSAATRLRGSGTPSDIALANENFEILEVLKKKGGKTTEELIKSLQNKTEKLEKLVNDNLINNTTNPTDEWPRKMWEIGLGEPLGPLNHIIGVDNSIVFKTGRDSHWVTKEGKSFRIQNTIISYDDLVYLDNKNLIYKTYGNREISVNLLTRNDELVALNQINIKNLEITEFPRNSGHIGLSKDGTKITAWDFTPPSLASTDQEGGNGGGNETVNSRLIIKTAGPDISLATDGKLGAAELQKSNDLRSWRRQGDVPAEASEVLVTPRESGNEFYRLKKK